MESILRKILTHFLIINCGLVITSSGLSSRIYYGRRVKDISEYPFMVSVYYNSNFPNHCGGAIIRDDAVLTTAHCVAYPGLPYVVAGRTLLDDTDPANVQPRKAYRVVRHPNYSHDHVETTINDIAVLLLDEILHFNYYVKAIKLPDSPLLPVNKLATVIGWGNTEYSEFSNELLAVDLTILSYRECLQMMSGMTDSPYISPELICAFDKTNSDKGTCWGDGGGPLFLRYRNNFILVGLVKYGVTRNGQCCNNYPSTYVNVVYNKNFINSALGQKS